MARTPQIPTADFDAIVEQLVEEGYPREKIRLAPQDGS